MKCIKCGVELADDALFCHECGAKVEAVETKETVVEDKPETANASESAETQKNDETVSETQTESENNESEAADTNASSDDFIFCPECGTKNEKGALFCGSCGKKFGEDVFLAAKEKEKKKKKASKSEKAGKGGFKKVLIAVGGIAAALVVIFLAYTFVPKVFSGGSKQNYVLHYLKDNKIYTAKSSKYKPKEVTNHFYESEKDSVYGKTWDMGPQMSANGKYLVYIKKIESNNIGGLYFQKVGKPDTEEKLASSVSSFHCIGNDYVLYETDDNRLYYIDYQGNKEKIASDVSVVEVSKDCRYVLIEEWADPDWKLYLFDFNNKKDGKEKLANVTNMHLASKNFDTLIYSKEDSLYVLKNFKTEEKIAKHVEKVNAYEEDGKISMYYATLEDTEKASAYDFVSDPTAAEDKNKTLPQMADYQKKNGKKVEVDEQYYKDYEEFQRKQDRDKVREVLKKDTTEINTYDIYYYTPSSKEAVKLGESRMFVGVTDYFDCFGKDVMVMCSLNDQASSLFTMEEMSSYNNIESQIDERFLSAVDMTFFDGKKGYLLEQDTLDLTTANSIYGFSRNSETGQVYYRKKTGSSYDIYEVSPNGKNLAINMIDSDVDEYDLYSYGALVTFKDMNKKATSADLYVDGTKVASDVYPNVVHFNPDSSSELFYMTDYSDGTAVLYHYDIKSKKSVKVDDEFYTYGGIVKVDGNSFAFLSDFSEKSQTGDLKVFNGTNTVLVDSDVSDYYYDYRAEYARSDD